LPTLIIVICVDGLIEDDSIIEIKCPFSAITEVNMLEAVKNGKVSP